MIPTTQYGGTVNTGGATNDNLVYTPILPTFTSWTASTLIKFDGTAASGYAGNLVLLCDTGTTKGIALDSATSDFFDFANSLKFTTTCTSLTGWQRLTFVCNATNTSMYLNGAFVSSIAQASTMPLCRIVDGWPWPVADWFFWGVALTASQVAAHTLDPYRTVLKPRFELFRTTSGAVTNKSLPASTTPAASAQRQISKVLQATTTPVASATNARAYLRTLQATTTPAVSASLVDIIQAVVLAPPVGGPGDSNRKRKPKKRVVEVPVHATKQVAPRRPSVVLHEPNRPGVLAVLNQPRTPPGAHPSGSVLARLRRS